MVRKNQVHVGDRVTCLRREEAYGSRYAGNPACFFEPGNVGILGAVNVPYVTGPEKTFCCVDFEGPQKACWMPATRWRAALDYDNIRLLPKDPPSENAAKGVSSPKEGKREKSTKRLRTRKQATPSSATDSAQERQVIDPREPS